MTYATKAATAITNGDLFLNQYGQVLWVAMSDAVSVGEDATEVDVQVQTVTRERFTRRYSADERFGVTQIGLVRFLRIQPDVTPT